MGSCLAQADVFEPTVISLSQHEAAPEWLQDGKLGIYFHWGVYSVAAYGNEWYPRSIHFEGSGPNKFHREKYGELNEFGYHDLIPLFKAEHFDADEWAALFKASGACFAGPVAEHHDGFAMWDSAVTPWNAMDMGPKRDLVGEILTAVRKQDLKTITTFHHARNLQRLNRSWKKEHAKGIHKGFKGTFYPYHPELPTGSADPKLRMLYGNMPEGQWLEELWLPKLKEVIDAYHPDLIWFDSTLGKIPMNYRLEFAAYYLNAAEQWEGAQVGIIRKLAAFPDSFSIRDHEKSREPDILPDVWMTDDTLSTGSWSYTEDLQIKPLYKVVHALIDTVSKNGVVLLNISPKADGTIPQNQKDALLGLGAWLKQNGEAIYGTRPWINAAEGPAAAPEGGLKNAKKFLALEYSAKDIRYTASKDGKTVYAFALGIPGKDESIVLKTFLEKGIEVDRVELLNGDAVQWEMSDTGLEVHLITPATEDMAVILRISLN
ncbi:alpha-L-fucosidase [Pontiella sp. NLcol2]|uniref:alpha-L-fucosidase n=1 Tax=Pontiella agarivorans TaxID=3038953 RepID=A0ABU5MXX1_9BACT|nr:alpha-L-fucosidase [Pontiella agarivorans]